MVRVYTENFVDIYNRSINAYNVCGDYTHTKMNDMFERTNYNNIKSYLGENMVYLVKPVLLDLNVDILLYGNNKTWNADIDSVRRVYMYKLDLIDFELPKFYKIILCEYYIQFITAEYIERSKLRDLIYNEYYQIEN